MHFMFSPMDLHREWEMLFASQSAAARPESGRCEESIQPAQRAGELEEEQVWKCTAAKQWCFSPSVDFRALSRGGKYHHGDWKQQVKWLLMQKGRGTVWDLFTPRVFSVNKTTSFVTTQSWLPRVPLPCNQISPLWAFHGSSPCSIKYSLGSGNYTHFFRPENLRV